MFFGLNKKFTLLIHSNKQQDTSINFWRFHQELKLVVISMKIIALLTKFCYTAYSYIMALSFLYGSAAAAAVSASYCSLPHSMFLPTALCTHLNCRQGSERQLQLIFNAISKSHTSVSLTATASFAGWNVLCWLRLKLFKSRASSHMHWHLFVKSFILPHWNEIGLKMHK